MPSDSTSGEGRDLFDVVGSFGPWQKVVFAVFFLVNVVGIWQNFAITFLAPNMDFWCVEPWNASAALPGLSHDQCQLVVNGTSNGSESSTVSCTRWKYDTSYFSETLVSEWDLVCDREWLVSLAKSVYMIGFLISVIFFGQLADCIGRYPVVVISYVITVVSLLLSLLSSSYLMFIILRFFQAFGRTGLTTTGFVLMMELIGPRHRTQVGIAIQLGWSVGFFLLAAVAWVFRHWFWFQLAISVPMLPMIFAFKYIPESPRWLLMQEKFDKLEKLVATAAKMNKKELKGDIKELCLSPNPTEAEKGSGTKTILDMFRTPKMRNRAFNMIYLWMVNAFMYYGLSYNTNDLAGDPYLNFFVAGVLEFPSYAVVYLAIRRFGRRPTLVALMLVGGAACAAVIPVPYETWWLATTFSMVGKFCITGSFGLLYLYTSELFPTVVRNVAVGSCSMFARVGSIVAPFVKELGKATHPSVPNLVYTLLAVSSGLLALLLPETKGQKTPDTLHEGEHFGEELSQEKQFSSEDKQ